MIECERSDVGSVLQMFVAGESLGDVPTPTAAAAELNVDVVAQE